MPLLLLFLLFQLPEGGVGSGGGIGKRRQGGGRSRRLQTSGGVPRRMANEGAAALAIRTLASSSKECAVRRNSSSEETEKSDLPALMTATSTTQTSSSDVSTASSKPIAKVANDDDVFSVVSCRFVLWEIHYAVKLLSFYWLGWNDHGNDEHHVRFKVRQCQMLSGGERNY